MSVHVHTYTCVCVYAMCLQVPVESRRGRRIPEAGVPGGSELLGMGAGKLD